MKTIGNGNNGFSTVCCYRKPIGHTRWRWIIIAITSGTLDEPDTGTVGLLSLAVGNRSQ
jgi:hypothetical protein